MGFGFWKDTLREGHMKHGVRILEGHVKHGVWILERHVKHCFRHKRFAERS